MAVGCLFSLAVPRNYVTCLAHPCSKLFVVSIISIKLIKLNSENALSALYLLDSAFVTLNLTVVIRSLAIFSFADSGFEVLVCLGQVLHKGRANSPLAEAKEARKFLDGLRKEGCFYVTPFGSNDDWCVLRNPTKFLLEKPQSKKH